MLSQVEFCDVMICYVALAVVFASDNADLIYRLWHGACRAATAAEK